MSLRKPLSRLLLLAIAASSSVASAQVAIDPDVIVAVPLDPDVVIGKSTIDDIQAATRNTRSSDDAAVPSYARRNDLTASFGMNNKYFGSKFRLGTAVSGRHRHEVYGNEVRADGYANLDARAFGKNFSIFDSHTYAINRSKTANKVSTNAYIVGQELFSPTSFEGPAPSVVANKTKSRDFFGGCAKIPVWLFKIETCGEIGGGIGIEARAYANQPRAVSIEMGPRTYVDADASVGISGPFGQLTAGVLTRLRVLEMKAGPTAEVDWAANFRETTYSYESGIEGCIGSLSGEFGIFGKAFPDTAIEIYKEKILQKWNGFRKCKMWKADSGSQSFQLPIVIGSL